MNQWLLFAFLWAPAVAYAQLTLVVNDLPDNTPDDAMIYVTGSFEGWSGGISAYALSEVSPGQWEITFTPTPGFIEYKFTRGNWDMVEGNENGGFLPNRSLTYDGTPQTEALTISSWEDLGGSGSTAAANVFVLDTDFYMPELDRYRRIWMYVPPNYESTNDHYKVLYMHDGQNVFDTSTSFSGEWQVDETLNDLFAAGDPGCIVVAIDNGGTERINEYSPWVNPSYGGGDGALYMEFIVETLKPYIDANYRTLPDREWTGIMGSSLGGLISTFGGLEHNETFSRIGAFSPSYWFSEESFAHAVGHSSAGPNRIYSIAGALEGDIMTGPAADMEVSFEAAGLEDSEHTLTVHDDGTHSEWYWAREFEAAYLWLWPEVADAIEAEAADEVAVRVYPNPAAKVAHLHCGRPMQVESLRVLDAGGKLLFQQRGWTDRLNLGEWPTVLVLQVLFTDGSERSVRFQHVD